MNEIVVFDNSTNSILLFNGVYDVKNQKYRILDYTRSSIIIGNDSQFIDFKTRKMVVFKREGMIFRGVVTSQMDSFIGKMIGDEVTIIFSNETYTFDCKSINDNKGRK